MSPGPQAESLLTLLGAGPSGPGRRPRIGTKRGYAPRTPARLADGLGAEGCPVARYGAIRPKGWVPRSPVLRETRRVTAFAHHWNQKRVVRQGYGSSGDCFVDSFQPSIERSPFTGVVGLTGLWSAW